MTRDKALKLFRLKSPFSMTPLVSFMVCAVFFISGIDSSFGDHHSHRKHSPHNENVATLQNLLIKNGVLLGLRTPANEIGDYFGKVDGFFDKGVSQVLEELLVRAQIHVGKSKEEITSDFTMKGLQEIQEYMDYAYLDHSDMELFNAVMQEFLTTNSEFFATYYRPGNTDVKELKENLFYKKERKEWIKEAERLANDPDSGYFDFPELSDEQRAIIAPRNHDPR